MPRAEARESLDALLSEVPVQGRTIRPTFPATRREHKPRKRSRKMSKWAMASPFVAIGVVAIAAYAALAYIMHVLEEHAP
jgi:predicted MFS family arabinose efflux permease